MNGKINNCAKKIEKDPHKYDEYLPKVIKLHHQEMVYMWCLLGLLTALAIAVVFDIIMNGISALDYSFFILMAANVVAIFLLAHQRKTTPEMLKPAIDTIKQMHLTDYNEEQQEILKELLIISCVVQKERQALEILQTSNNKEIINKLYKMLEEDIDKINKI